jgi:hypothetical protein
MESPPEKEEGALRHAPTPKLTGLPQHNCGIGSAQSCTHSATVTERLPATHRHHARLMCAVCGRFLRWLPRPETIERERVNAFRMARLAMHPDLTGWERQFIRSVGGKKHLSPKQQALLVRLCAQYSEGKTS